MRKVLAMNGAHDDSMQEGGAGVHRTAFPGQKAYHCRDRVDLGVEDTTQDDTCKQARKMNSTNKQMMLL